MPQMENLLEKNKLQYFLKNASSQCNYYFSACVRIELTQHYPGNTNRLNTFHLRGLRYILNIEHSYYPHISNIEVIAQMNLHLSSAESGNISWTQFKIDKEFKTSVTNLFNLWGI